jgi:hypothetical protein
MPAATVAVDEHRIGLAQLRRIRPFGVEMDFDGNIRRTLRQALGEELNARIVFVFARTVRLLASDQDDEGLSIGRFCEGDGRKRCEAKGEKVGGFQHGGNEYGTVVKAGGPPLESGR